MQVNKCEMESLDSDNRKLDECLNNFEDAVKREKCYLLYSPYFANINFQVWCGLSPARSFSPIITLSRPYSLVLYLSLKMNRPPL